MDWEMTHLDEVDLIMLYLHPGTISPVSLLELGRYSRSGRLIVCCPKGYHRRGNVQYLFRKDSVPLFEEFDKFVKARNKRLEDITRENLPLEGSIKIRVSKRTLLPGLLR
ncbi:hypothetical protein PMIN01_08230 [Paraphaeosphaeria minitans]|uniref:Uncharacterized protein n=1 Tax=Paraphaeosphaeria minitans TaxID=565426 RepID=A0A9P6GE23_9PLEO|nr:hypothetical protein PMIN01_08164 [Paraphaeosphaeria minitans]KAF9733887.1 hypothetical protein PMIN01_08230 [Paraphaeosphaeria minitans]